MKEFVIDQQLIDVYLTKKNTLSPQECELIEERLRNDKKFKEVVALQKEVIKAIQLTFNQELKNRLKS